MSSMDKALAKLEEAREAMHADRNPKTIAAYKTACKIAAAERSAWREAEIAAGRRPGPAAPGDAAPSPDTLNLTVGVNQ